MLCLVPTIMTKLKEIIKATEQFYNMHWCQSTDTRPFEWNSNWHWEGSVPNHEKPNVYALLEENDEVIYIGLGASRIDGHYKEHGIFRRLLAHAITTNKAKGRGHYQPRRKWSEVVGVGAVGFHKEFSYLAPALEDYLIGLFSPVRNTIKKRI